MRAPRPCGVAISDQIFARACGYSFGGSLQGCTNTVATFSGSVHPGTYKFTVTGRYSDLPGVAYVAVSKLAIP